MFVISITGRYSKFRSPNLMNLKNNKNKWISKRKNLRNTTSWTLMHKRFSTTIILPQIPEGLHSAITLCMTWFPGSFCQIFTGTTCMSFFLIMLLWSRIGFLTLWTLLRNKDNKFIQIHCMDSRVLWHWLFGLNLEMTFHQDPFTHLHFIKE